MVVFNFIIAPGRSVESHCSRQVFNFNFEVSHEMIELWKKKGLMLVGLQKIFVSEVFPNHHWWPLL